MARHTAPEELVASLLRQAHGRTVGLLFDYDGTLADIRPTPAQAVIGRDERENLVRLAQSPRARVAIVTGRSKAGLLAVSGPLDGVTLALNGGLHIVSPGREWTMPDVEKFRPALARAEKIMADAVAEWPGTILEEKELSMTVHFRLRPDAQAALESALQSALERENGQLRTLPGKQSFEIQPNVPWDKGRAATWLLDDWGVGDAALFLGDDRIDEPAFTAVAAVGGLTCRVATTGEATSAGWVLPSPTDARRVLALLADALTDL